MRSKYGSRLLAVLFIAALLSAYLLYHHVAVNSGYLVGPSTCSISNFDCESVALSSYSTLLGQPVAAWGLLFYLVFGFFILLQPKESGSANSLHLKSEDSAAAHLFLASVGLLIAVAFFLISWQLIGAFCLFCSCLYLVHLILFGIAFFRSRPR